MKRGVIFWVSIPARWEHAKTRCVFETYATICISGKTGIFKIKIFNQQNIVLFYIWATAFQCGGGGGGDCLFLSPFFQGDHRTPIYTTSKGTPNIPFIEAHRKVSPKHVPIFVIVTNLSEISASSSKNVETHGPIWQTCLS